MEWRGKQSEVSEGHSGGDRKCEVLPSAISKHVSELGERSTEQWIHSSGVGVELGIKSVSTAFGSSKSLWSLTGITEASW